MAQSHNLSKIKYKQTRSMAGTLLLFKCAIKNWIMTNHVTKQRVFPVVSTKVYGWSNNPLLLFLLVMPLSIALCLLKILAHTIFLEWVRTYKWLGAYWVNEHVSWKQFQNNYVIMSTSIILFVQYMHCNSHTKLNIVWILLEFICHMFCIHYKHISNYSPSKVSCIHLHLMGN